MDPANLETAVDLSTMLSAQEGLMGKLHLLRLRLVESAGHSLRQECVNMVIAAGIYMRPYLHPAHSGLLLKLLERGWVHRVVQPVFARLSRRVALVNTGIAAAILMIRRDRCEPSAYHSRLQHLLHEQELWSPAGTLRSLAVARWVIAADMRMMPQQDMWGSRHSEHLHRDQLKFAVISRSMAHANGVTNAFSCTHLQQE
jgi:hypothetical protein